MNTNEQLHNLLIISVHGTQQSVTAKYQTSGQVKLT